VVELRHAIALKANYSEAYYVLGETLRQMSQQEEAQAAFAEVERLRRTDADFAEAKTQYTLGLQSLDKGDLGAARDAFAKALAIKPDFAEAHTNLGSVLLKLGETRSAIGHFRAAIDLQPADARAYYNLALALEREGDTVNSRKARERALALDPRLAESGSTSHR
jgi:Flp pilus assembly protein TadD